MASVTLNIGSTTTSNGSKVTRNWGPSGNRAEAYFAWKLTATPSGTSYTITHDLYCSVSKKLYGVTIAVLEDSVRIKNGTTISKTCTWNSTTAYNVTVDGMSRKCYHFVSSELPVSHYPATSGTKLLSFETSISVNSGSVQTTNECYAKVTITDQTDPDTSTSTEVNQTWDINAPSRSISTTFNLGYTTWRGDYDWDYRQFTATKSGVATIITEYNTKNYVPKLDDISFTTTGTQSISLSYNVPNGCVYSGGESHPALNKSVKYTSCKFKTSRSSSESGYSPGSQIGPITTSGTYYSTWSEGSPVITGRKITLPTITTHPRGYKFLNWTYNGANCGYSGGTSLRKFTENDDGGTITANCTANKYQVKFDMNIGSASKSIITPQAINGFTKVFDTDYTLPEVTPVWAQGARIFNGWCTTSDGQPSGGVVAQTWQPGSIFTDPTIYNNDTTIITLYALWSDVKDKINVYYSQPNSESSQIVYEQREFGYTNLPYSLRNPQWEDHAFVGWVKTKPASWDTNSGVYKSSADIEPELDIDNNVVYINGGKYPYLNDEGNWGIEDTFWGLWVSSKKYICTSQHTNGEGCEWKAVDTVYVKTNETTATGSKWHRVTDIYVKTDDGWKHLDE